jgi:predicted nucleotidyltransferase
MSSVSSAHFQRNLGECQDMALVEPVTITKNGRERLVLLSVEEYRRLVGRADPANRRRKRDRPQSDAKRDLLTKALKGALAPHSRDIESAFVYGSFAKGTQGEASDVDLMVIGKDLNYSDLYTSAFAAEQKLGRKVSATFLSPEEWKRKASRNGTFVQKVSELPKVFIVGSEKDLRSWDAKNSKRSSR